MRRACIVLGLTAAGAIAGACSGGRSSRSVDSLAPERVILITIDTLRADHLGCYADGAAQTPVLDALARESILYEDATSAAPITLVSHATMLTGLIPPAHGVRTNGSFRLPARIETLAERLKSRGFATGAFVGAFVLHHEFGLDQGFDVYDDVLPRSERGRRFDFAERRASVVLSRASDWVKARRSDRFFLWVHLFDPHAPYDPPPPFDGRFSARPYDGEIAYVDAQLGEFFQSLRAAGLWDRSLLIVTADHGEGLGDHGEKTHGLFLYQSTLRVPLIVRPPGGAAPAAHVRRPVGLVDITPTVLAAIGAPPEPALDGHLLPGLPFRSGAEAPSAADASASRAATERQGVAGLSAGAKAETQSKDAPAGEAAYYCENLMPHYSFGWAGLRGYRVGTTKIIRAVRSELYDLAPDPNETNDLAGGGEAASGAGPRPPAGVSSRLLAALEAKLDEVRSREGAADVGGDAANPGLSQEARDNLLALGYVASAVHPGTPTDAGPDPREMLPFFEGIEEAKDDLRSGRRDAAIEVLERLAAKGPGSVGVLGLLGQARMEQGDVDGAMRALVRARTIDPRDYEIRRRIAEAHYAKGAYEAAAAEAREALKLNDRNAESRSVLGAALARLGRHDEAIASFREAIAQRPEEAALHYNLGLALERAARPSEAETAYARAIELDPAAPSAPARVALASLLLKRHDPESARRQLEEAVRVDPRNGAALEQLGITLAALGEMQAALSAFDRLIALDPGRAEAEYDRGLVLEKLGRPAEAAAAFRGFLTRWKGDPARARAAEEHLRRLGG